METNTHLDFAMVWIVIKISLLHQMGFGRKILREPNILKAKVPKSSTWNHLCFGWMPSFMCCGIGLFIVQ